jgi:hypothetical protein
MGSRLPHELLQELRTYLQHFDDTGHLGERSTVAEIKRRLEQRIVEVEAQIRTMPPKFAMSEHRQVHSKIA